MKNILRVILGKNSLVYLSANIITSVVSVLLVLLLTRYLTPEEYGSLGIYLAITNVVLWCLGPGITIRRLYVSSHAKAESISEDLGVFLCLYSLIIILIIAVSLAFGEIIAGWSTIDLWLVVAAIINGFLVSYITVAHALWLMSQSAVLYAFFKILISLVNFGLTTLGVAYFASGWVSAALASLVASFIVVVLCLYIINQQFGIAFVINKVVMRRAIESFLPIIPLNISFAVIGNLGAILVSSYVGMRESGFYVFALQLTAAIPLLYDSIASAILPPLLSCNGSQPISQLRKVEIMFAYAVLLLLATAALILIVPFIINLVFPHVYSVAIPLVICLAIARCIGGIGRPIVEMVVYKKERLTDVAIYYLGVALIYVISTILLLHEYEAIGAAIGLLLGHALRVVVSIFLLKKHN